MNPSPIVNLLPIFLIFIVMYFLIIRPQMKQQRELGQMQTKLKKNDEVVTTGGVHGVVANIKETTVTLRVDDSVRIEVDKTAVVRRIKEG